MPWAVGWVSSSFSVPGKPNTSLQQLAEWGGDSDRGGLLGTQTIRRVVSARKSVHPYLYAVILSRIKPCARRQVANQAGGRGRAPGLRPWSVWAGSRPGCNPAGGSAEHATRSRHWRQQASMRPLNHGSGRLPRRIGRYNSRSVWSGAKGVASSRTLVNQRVGGHSLLTPHYTLLCPVLRTSAPAARPVLRNHLVKRGTFPDRQPLGTAWGPRQ